MFSVEKVCFQGEVSEHYCQTDITEVQNDNVTKYMQYTPSIAPVSNSDYNKTDGH